LTYLIESFAPGAAIARRGSGLSFCSTTAPLTNVSTGCGMWPGLSTAAF
jgi:hypothetical protein